MNYTKQIETLFDAENWEGVVDMLEYVFNEENNFNTGLLLSARLNHFVQYKKEKLISEKIYLKRRQKIKESILYFVRKIDNNDSNFKNLSMAHLAKHNFSFLEKFVEPEHKKFRFSFFRKLSKNNSSSRRYCLASYHILATLLKDTITYLESTEVDESLFSRKKEKATEKYKDMYQVYLHYYDVISEEIKRLSSSGISIKFDRKYNDYKNNILRDSTNNNLLECRTANLDKYAALMRDEILTRNTIFKNTYHSGLESKYVFIICNLEIQMRRIVLIDYMNRKGL